MLKCLYGKWLSYMYLEKKIWKNVIIYVWQRLLFFTLLYVSNNMIMYAYQLMRKIVINFKLSVLLCVYSRMQINLVLQITMSLKYGGIWFQKHFTGLETIITQNGKSYSSSTTLPLTNYPEWLELTALEWQVLKNLMVLNISKEFVWK